MTEALSLLALVALLSYWAGWMVGWNRREVHRIARAAAALLLVLGLPGCARDPAPGCRPHEESVEREGETWCCWYGSPALFSDVGELCYGTESQGLVWDRRVDDRAESRRVELRLAGESATGRKFVRGSPEASKNLGKIYRTRTTICAEARR